MTQRKPALNLLLILLPILSFMFGSPALANPPCHSVLLSDTDLTGDLDCSGVDGDPLIVGADGITIRLNGWTLTCPPGFVNSGGELDVEGIRTTNHVGVSVIGPGKVTGCGRAVAFQGGSDNVVRGLYLSGNLSGLSFQGGADHTAQKNVIVSNEGTAIATSGVVNVQILDNWIAANGGDPDPARGFGMTNDNASSATITRNNILGNFRGGIAEVGASTLISKISRNIILGNGEFDLNLRDTDDTVERTICETSNPVGLCPDPLPPFPFDKGKRK